MRDGLMGKKSLQRIIISTTRYPREGEIDGEDYRFNPMPLVQNPTLCFMNTQQL